MSIHRYDALHFVDTAEHRCTCGWISESTTRPNLRVAVIRQAIGSHATAANKAAR